MLDEYAPYDEGHIYSHYFINNHWHIYIYALLPLSFYKCWSLNRRIFAGFIQTGFFWYFSPTFLKVTGFFPWFFSWKHLIFPWPLPKKLYLLLASVSVIWPIILTEVCKSSLKKKFTKKNNTKNVTAVNKKIIKNENRKSTTTI